MFEILSALFGLSEHEQISIPTKAEILIQLQIANFMEIQAGMVMDQTLPLRQTPVLWFGSGVGDGGDLEFGSDTTPLMKDM